MLIAKIVSWLLSLDGIVQYHHQSNKLFQHRKPVLKELHHKREDIRTQSGCIPK